MAAAIPSEVPDSRHSDSVSEDAKRRLRNQWIAITSHLRPDACLLLLKDRKAITADVYQTMYEMANTKQMTSELLGRVERGSQYLYDSFVDVLRATNQHFIADLLDLTRPIPSTQEPSLSASSRQSFLDASIQHTLRGSLRFESNFIIHLEGNGVITVDQVDELHNISSRRKRTERLVRLLEIGFTQERLDGFITALTETEQPHLALLVDKGDNSLLIPESDRKAMLAGKAQLIDYIRDKSRGALPGLLQYLVTEGIITRDQVYAVREIGNTERQLEELFDVILCRPRLVVQRIVLKKTGGHRVEFRIPALEGAPSCSRGEPSPIDARGTYLQKLRSSVKDAAIEKNQRLNENFGIQLDTVLYCDLAMASQMTGMPDESADTSAIEEYIRRTAESLKIKHSVSIDNVFAQNTKEQRKGRPNRVLLLGGAGMGKTTVLQELSRRWSEGALKTPKVLACYRFECRNFTDDIKKGKEFSLTELLYKRHPPSNISGDEKAALAQLIIDKKSDIMIAVDGLDELAGWKSCEYKAPEIYDITEPGEIHHVLYNLIRGNLLPEANVLVTSRPTTSVKQKDFVSCLVALGFSEASIMKCMKTLCKTEGLAQLVIDYIYRTNLVADCIVPLTCILLGVVLGRDLAQESGGQPPSSEINSMTRLYSRVSTECVWRRDEDKDHADMLSDLTEIQKASFLKLAKLASHGMFGEETVVVFDNSDLAAVDMRADGEWFGLLEVSLTGGPSRDYKRPCIASFLHLTVEEFLAAVHLALTWDPVLLKTLAGKESQRLDMVAMFTCGLLGDSEGRRFLKALSPRFSDHIADLRSKELLKHISPSEKVDKLARLQYLRCVSEGRLGDLVPETQGSLLVDDNETTKLDLDNFPGGLLPHHLAAVGYGAQFTQLSSLSLHHCQITSQGVQALERSSPNLKCLRKLRLFSNSLGDAGVEALLPLLARNGKLEYLNLYSNQISDKGAELLAASLLKHPYMQRLDLDHNQITDEGTSGLAAALRANQAIEILRIFNNKLSEARSSGLKEEFQDRIHVYEEPF